MPNEDVVARQIADQMTLFLRRTYANSTAERAGNTKTYGVVRARFEVPELPEDLRVGVFREPREYTAWVRFGGPGPLVVDDIIDNGILSIGIKLVGVEGEKLSTTSARPRTSSASARRRSPRRMPSRT